MPAVLPPPPAWFRDAACDGYPPQYWFADVVDDWPFPINRATATKRAKALCEDCPVKRECLDYALEHHLRDGIYGGLTHNQRRVEARRRRRLEAS